MPADMTHAQVPAQQQCEERDVFYTDYSVSNYDPGAKNTRANERPTKPPKPDRFAGPSPRKDASMSRQDSGSRAIATNPLDSAKECDYSSAESLQADTLDEDASAPTPDHTDESDEAASNAQSSHWRTVQQRVKAQEILKQGFHAQFNFGQREAPLCPACEGLKLTFDKFVIEGERPKQKSSKGNPDFWGKRLMGTWKEISERSHCSLCKLLSKSMGELSDLKDVLAAECRVYWAVDGRERVAQGEGSRLRTVKRTRRLSIEWSNKPDDRAYIVLVAPEGKFAPDGRISEGVWERPTLFLGRLLTSLEKSNVDKVKEWLALCVEKHHAHDCRVHDDQRQRFQEVLLQSPFFSVIDVKEMRLTSLPDDGDADIRYTALSYTWGEESRISGGHAPPPSAIKPRFKALNDNKADLMKPEGIRKVQNELPTSIQHAIYLTEQLEIRYLWVDSLCIVQDNDRSWDLNASVMDLVYSNAELTICAADGDGSDEVGLKALFPEKRHTRHAEEFAIDYALPGEEQLKLLLSRPSEYYIRQSRWNKRAWTFQERLLSRRCVMFVAGRVYFQCRSTTMSEDIYSEAAQAGWSVELQGSPALILNGLATNPIGVYKECLALYTSRSLSKEKDILAAFGGIANIIRTSVARKCAPVFGMPAAYFDFALLWEPAELPDRRKVSGRPFPSWSWCGWKGKTISYRESTVAGLEVNLHEWFLHHTWITFYIRDGQGDLRLVWDPVRYDCNDTIEERWKGYDSPKAGLPFGSKYHKSVKETPDFDFHGRPFNDDVPRRGRVEHAGRQFLRKYSEYPNHVKVLKPGEKGRGQGIPRPDEPILQFWTWTAEFFLGEEAVGEPFNNGAPVGAGLKRFAILDADGDFAGTCVLSEHWTKAARARPPIPQTFIALSDARDFDASEYGSWGLYTEDSRDIRSKASEPWRLFNVMMLCTGDEQQYQHVDDGLDVAYRAGLGKIYQGAFDCGAEESWKEIILG